MCCAKKSDTAKRKLCQAGQIAFDGTGWPSLLILEEPSDRSIKDSKDGAHSKIYSPAPNTSGFISAEWPGTTLTNFTYGEYQAPPGAAESQRGSARHLSESVLITCLKWTASSAFRFQLAALVQMSDYWLIAAICAGSRTTWFQRLSEGQLHNSTSPLD